MKSSVEKVDLLVKVGTTARQHLLDVPLVCSAQILFFENNFHQVQGNIPINAQNKKGPIDILLFTFYRANVGTLFQEK